MDAVALFRRRVLELILAKYRSLDRFYLETDFSKGHLSEILRGKGSPTVDTLTSLHKPSKSRCATSSFFLKLATVIVGPNCCVPQRPTKFGDYLANYPLERPRPDQLPSCALAPAATKPHLSLLACVIQENRRAGSFLRERCFGSKLFCF